MHDPIVGYAGVDWATDAHAVCVVDDKGGVIVEFDVAHTTDGPAELCRRVQHAGARRVAIERPDGPVVVSSRSVKALRERYGTSGNKSDRSDAERILARSWVHIIWRSWQDHTPYDPARHGGHQRLDEDAA